MITTDKSRKETLKQLKTKLDTKRLGRFYFSKKQREQLDDIGRHRMFCKSIETAKIHEYTEMIDVDMHNDNPNDMCWMPDAVHLG